MDRAELNLLVRDSGWMTRIDEDALNAHPDAPPLAVNIAAHLDEFSLEDVARFDELSGRDLLGDVLALVRSDPDLLHRSSTGSGFGEADELLLNLATLSDATGRNLVQEVYGDGLFISVGSLFGDSLGAELTPDTLESLSRGAAVLPYLAEQDAEMFSGVALDVLTDTMADLPADLDEGSVQQLLDATVQLAAHAHEDVVGPMLDTVAEALGVDLRDPFVALEHGLTHGVGPDGRLAPMQDVLGQVLDEDPERAMAYARDSVEALLSGEGQGHALLTLLQHSHDHVYDENSVVSSVVAGAMADGAVRELLQGALPPGVSPGELLRELAPPAGTSSPRSAETSPWCGAPTGWTRSRVPPIPPRSCRQQATSPTCRLTSSARCSRTSPRRASRAGSA